MKKLVLMSVLLFASLSAYASDAQFTKAEAVQNCPVPSQITFTASKGSMYQGIYNGMQNNYHFVSWDYNKQSKLAPAPVDPVNAIQYRNTSSTGEDYGYQSGDNIVCFYLVDKLIGGQYFMNMDTAHS